MTPSRLELAIFSVILLFFMLTPQSNPWALYWVILMKMSKTSLTIHLSTFEEYMLEIIYKEKKILFNSGFLFHIYHFYNRNQIVKTNYFSLIDNRFFDPINHFHAQFHFCQIQNIYKKMSTSMSKFSMNSFCMSNTNRPKENW